jgi:uncharacterized protein (DUF362 family)
MPGRQDAEERFPSPDELIALCRSATATYPVKPPFDPPEMYPEFPRHLRATNTDPTNDVYACVRESLRLLQLDIGNFGGPHWNPLKGIVVPGNHVLIKPNWVSQGHHLDGSWEQIITHGAVIRVVIDYVRLALEGRGRISLADGPMLSSDFGEIVKRSSIDEVMKYLSRAERQIDTEMLDLRTTFLETRDDVVVRRHRLRGDPRGEVVVDLGKSSLFYGFAGEGRYYGADYDTEEVNSHHRGEVQEYKLSGTAMSADVVIDVPKLKTHQKVGVTLAVKGIVGLNCGRNWLPHRTQGTPEQGGDQFADSRWRQRLEHAAVKWFEEASLQYPTVVPGVYRLAKRMGKHVFGPTHRTVRGGGWHGNGTLWRMALDINRALMYADSTGRLHERPTKRRFCIIDGIIAGEGVGPIYADAKACGIIIAGRNAVAVDVVGAEVMGFDYERIAMLAGAFALRDFALVDFPASRINVVSNVPEWNGGLGTIRSAEPFRFAVPIGWQGQVERRTEVCSPRN